MKKILQPYQNVNYYFDQPSRFRTWTAYRTFQLIFPTSNLERQGVLRVGDEADQKDSLKSVKLPERVRVTMFFALVRCVCRWHKVPFRKCVWALRQEPGEIGGRLHFHFLLAGLPPYAV